MMVKKTVGSSRRTRYKRRLIQLLDMADEPLSHHEIITYTKQWKHGIPTFILSNILSKDEAFEIYGTVKSAQPCFSMMSHRRTTCSALSSSVTASGRKNQRKRAARKDAR